MEAALMVVLIALCIGALLLVAIALCNVASKTSRMEERWEDEKQEEKDS